jgi:hypothetical protein
VTDGGKASSSSVRAHYLFRSSVVMSQR